MANNKVSFDVAGALAHWFDEEGRAVITAAASSAAPRWRGKFGSRMYAVRSTKMGKLRFEIRNDSDSPRWEWLEFGTRGTQTGNPSRKLPPIDSIKDWAVDHGIQPWALAVSIQKKGTKPQPFIEKAKHAADVAIAPMIDKVIWKALGGS